VIGHIAKTAAAFVIVKGVKVVVPGVVVLRRRRRDRWHLVLAGN
jgi:hypothetical protein